MPPRKSPPLPAPTVANLSHEEKISWLVHQHEGIQDWRLTVDEQLAENKGATEQLRREVSEVKESTTRLENSVREMQSGQKDTHILLGKVLLAVQGQTDKGLERPGLTDDVKRIEAALQAHRDKCETDRVAALERIETMEKWKNRALWTFAGFTAIAGPALFLYSDKLSLIAQALSK